MVHSVVVFSPSLLASFRRLVPAILMLGLAAGCAEQPSAPSLDAGAVSEPKSTSLYGAYLAGSLAERNGDLSQAATYLNSALEKDPDNIDLLRQTFIVTVGDGRMDQAVSLARRVNQREPENILAAVFLAFEDIRAGRWEGADLRLAALPKNGLNNLLVPLARAWAAAGRNDQAAANEHLRLLGENNAFASLAAVHRGLIAEFLGDRATADKVYVDLLRADPTPPYRILEVIGNYYERFGKPERARRLYEGFVENAPGTLLMVPALARLDAGKLPPPVVPNIASGLAEAMFDIAYLVHRERNGDQVALINIRFALWLQPDFPIAQMLLSDIFDAQKRPQDSLVIDRALAQGDSPFRWNARLRMAVDLDALGDEAQAISQLRVMAAEKPERIDALAQLGDILRSHKRYTEAVAAYDEAVKRLKTLDRRYWSLLFSRAIALERSGQIDRAVADLQQAISFQPDEPYLLNYLGYVWVERGERLDEARQMIEKAASLKPEDGSIVDSLGWAFYMQGNYERAVVELERAADLKRNDPTVSDHLGDAYWRVGRRSDARVLWRRALSFDPDKELREAVEKKLQNGLDPAKTADKR